MSTAIPTAAPKGTLPKVEGMRVAIVQAEWNEHITGALTRGALELFKAQGFDDGDVQVFKVPGAVELTFGASQLIAI